MFIAQFHLKLQLSVMAARFQIHGRKPGNKFSTSPTSEMPEVNMDPKTNNNVNNVLLDTRVWRIENVYRRPT